MVIPILLFLCAWGGNQDDIKKTAGTINSISADFTQKKMLKILSKPLISKGKLYYQKPSSLRWEYESPVKSILLMHGSTVKRYIWHNGKMIEDSSAQIQSMQVVMNEISGWFRGDFESTKTFTATVKPGRMIELVPKEKGLVKIIQKISVKLSTKPGVIERVTITEGPDSLTVLEFTAVSLNKTIPASLFKKI